MKKDKFITSGPVLYHCLHASPPYMGVRVGGQSVRVGRVTGIVIHPQYIDFQVSVFRC